MTVKKTDTFGQNTTELHHVLWRYQHPAQSTPPVPDQHVHPPQQVPGSGGISVVEEMNFDLQEVASEEVMLGLQGVVGCWWAFQDWLVLAGLEGETSLLGSTFLQGVTSLQGETSPLVGAVGGMNLVVLTQLQQHLVMLE